MKKLILSGVASAVLMMATSTFATAADWMDDRRGSAKDGMTYGGSLKDTDYVEAAHCCGWYLRGQLGFSANVDPDLKDSNDVAVDLLDYDNTWTLGVGVGYKFSSRFRADMTFDYRFGADAVGTYPLAGPGLESSAEVTTWAGLFNVYYDFDMGHRIQPYVGAGIGFANIEIEGADFFTSDETNFAWALMAGVNLPIGDCVSIDFGYRYLNMGDVNVNITPGAKATKYGTADYINVDEIEAHEFRVSLRWGFGGTGGVWGEGSGSSWHR